MLSAAAAADEARVSVNSRMGGDQQGGNEQPIVLNKRTRIGQAEWLAGPVVSLASPSRSLAGLL